MKNKITGFILILFVMVSFSSYSQKGKDAVEKKVRIAMPFFYSNLDPADEYNGWSNMRYGIGEALIKVSGKMELEGWLAKDFKKIDDLTWEIELRDNIKFHNGNLLTAEKAMKSLLRTKEKNDRAKKDLAKVTFSVEGNKIIAKTEEPDPTFINKLTDPMYVIVDVDAVNEKDFQEKPPCTGPYLVSKLVPNESAILLPFKDYWNGTPKLDSVEYILIRDANARMLALQTGDIDLTMSLTSSAVELFKGIDEIEVDKVPSMRITYIFMNAENKFLQDKKVREALNYALNIEVMSEKNLGGIFKASRAPYPETLPFGSDRVKTINYDLEKAKSLLAEAGYKDSDGDGFLDKDGEKFSVKISNLSYRGEVPVISQFIQGELRKIGVEIVIESYEQFPLEKYQAGDYDLGIDSYVIASSADPQKLLQLGFIEGASENYHKYFKSARVNEISKILETEGDVQKRYDLAFEAQQLILDETRNIFLGYTQQTVGRNKKVVNFTVHPLDYYQMNVNVDVVE